ncbi:hypothetical protein ScPMuIL_018747 [Solemya velum]
MVFSSLFRGLNMLAIDIKLVFLVLALIPLSYGVTDSYYPKQCDANYTKCLQGGQSSSLQCGTARVVCLFRYCRYQMKNIRKYQRSTKSTIQRSIAKCLIKHPGRRMSQMITKFGE